MSWFSQAPPVEEVKPTKALVPFWGLRRVPRLTLAERMGVEKSVR